MGIEGGDALSVAAAKKKHKPGEVIAEVPVTADRRGKSDIKIGKDGLPVVRRGLAGIFPKKLFSNNGNLFGKSNSDVIDGSEVDPK